MSETVYTIVPDGQDAFRVQAQSGDKITLSRQRFLDDQEARQWIHSIQGMAAKGRRAPAAQARAAKPTAAPMPDDPFLL